MNPGLLRINLDSIVCAQRAEDRWLALMMLSFQT